MTNEEMVAEIKNGRADMLLPLWKQNERLVNGMARAWKRAFDQLTYFDVDDLIQSAYLAMVDAVKYYNPESGCKFITVYVWFIKRHFKKIIGINSSKRDALFLARCSLDSPITEDESDAVTFGDTLPDPASNEDFDAVEDGIEQERIRSIINAVAGELLNDAQWAVYQRLLDDIKNPDKSEAETSRSWKYQQKRDVFRILRSDPRILQLWLDVTERYTNVSEIAENYMQKVGVGAFHENCASSVELAVEAIIKNEGMYRHKARRLNRMLSDKMSAEKELVDIQKKKWQRQTIISDLTAFEREREKRVAEG